jgi:hypothetical protein
MNEKNDMPVCITKKLCIGNREENIPISLKMMQVLKHPQTLSRSLTNFASGEELDSYSDHNSAISLASLLKMF